MNNKKHIKREKLFITSFAFVGLGLVYYLILTTLNQGISCDEGFYLMGYLSNQDLGSFISDYSRIVRAITPIGLEENIMTYRVERLLIGLFVFPFFAITLYHWLKHRFSFSMNRLLFYSLVFLATAQTYIFAAPTISYDSIQTFVYLLAFSFYFLLTTSSSQKGQFFYSLFIGVVSLVGVLNYFPSGLFLIGLLGVFILLDFPKNRFKILFYCFLGLTLGVVLYHFFVRDLIEYTQVAFETIMKTFTQKSSSGHDAGGLLSSFFLRIGYFIGFVPVIFLISLLFKKVKIPTKIISIISIVLMVFFLLYRKVYTIYAPIYFVPVTLLMAFFISEKKNFCIKKEFRFWMQILSLTVLPFFAVFGTNQNLYTKMVIFVPFWLMLFFIIYSKVENRSYKHSATLIFVAILLAGYVYLGNFSRYHYYYTPRSSKYELKNAIRTQEVKVSNYQREYFDELLDTLQHYGAKKGSQYLAFGENQMTVYLAGGYVVGKLPYHWFQYTEIPKKAPLFFILFKNEEKEVIDLLKNSNWSFPENYKRIEMRPMSENMDKEELKTIIYVPKR